MQATSVQWEKRFFLCVCALYCLYSEKSVFKFIEVHFFQLLIILMYRRCSLMMITITARTCKM